MNYARLTQRDYGLPELVWHCVSFNPDRWVLGIYDNGLLIKPQASVQRLKSGSWDWVLENTSIFGNEPSRKLAIETVNEICQH